MLVKPDDYYKRCTDCKQVKFVCRSAPWKSDFAIVHNKRTGRSNAFSYCTPCKNIRTQFYNWNRKQIKREKRWERRNGPI